MVDSAACRRTSALSTATKMRMDGVAASDAAMASNSASATYACALVSQQINAAYQAELQWAAAQALLTPAMSSSVSSRAPTLPV